MVRRSVLLLPLLLFVALPLPAQATLADNAGFGGVYLDIALDAATGSALNLGVAVDGNDGSIFVSATGAGAQPPHLVHRFDARGVLLGSFAQPAVHQATGFGLRDLAFDGQSLLGGSEAGISVFSTTGALSAAVLAQNGPQAVTQPIGGAALAALGVIRALAFDPAGNNGNGSLFVADFGSPILEIDLAGAILRTIPNGGWSAYGLAFDPASGNLWVHGDLAGRIAEIDLATGLLTGRAFEPVVSGAPGGLELASPAAGHHEPWPSRLLLASVVQGSGDDHLAIQRVHLHQGRLGWEEPVLRLGSSGGPLQRGVLPWRTGGSLEFHIDTATPGIGPFCWSVLNLYNDAAIDGYTALFPELRALTGLSVPASANFAVLTQSLGATLSLPLPPAIPVGTGDLLRVQGFYFDPTLPAWFGVTNEGYFAGVAGERGIVVEAIGPNSFQNDPAQPFWRVHSDLTHNHGAILGVELSFAGAALPAGSQRFDIDQLSMADRFDGGNSTVPHARGTYRNGSDVLCGLDYGAPGVYLDPALHVLPGQSAGFAAVFVPGHTLDAQTLVFAFTAFLPGRSFEFDCDTDGGLPGAEAHAGTIVRVQTANSGLLTGVLRVDPGHPHRAVVDFP